MDFARFNGLQTLVDMNDVADGTYTGVTITLGTATMSYLNTSGSGAPTITTLTSTTTPALTLTSSTVTASFANPLVISAREASRWACAWTLILRSRSR